MLAVEQPIGRFVVYANRDKNIFKKRFLKKEVANVVDLISTRIQSQTISEVASELHEEIFELRLSIINWLIQQNKETGDYLDCLTDYINTNLHLASCSDLANAVSSSLILYEEIVTPVIQSNDFSLESLIKPFEPNQPEYHTLSLLESHPLPQIRNLKKWLDTSLQFEVGLILADLILTNQVNIDKDRVDNELISYLTSIVEQFGAYSIFTGFWKPMDITRTRINRIKILAAKLELEAGNSVKMSDEEFKELIFN